MYNKGDHFLPTSNNMQRQKKQINPIDTHTSYVCRITFRFVLIIIQLGQRVKEDSIIC